jgi:hypothetical protein
VKLIDLDTHVIGCQSNLGYMLQPRENWLW